jgi:hypothetical protein
MKGAANRGGGAKKIYFPDSVSYLPPATGGTTLHVLVEGFSIFGVQVQYWMLLAVLIVAFVVIAVRPR